MTPEMKQTERTIRRRAEALARERTAQLQVLPVLDTRIICVQSGAGWAAVVTVKAGQDVIVREDAIDNDPTAALLALPRVLMVKIEEVRERLLRSLTDEVRLNPTETL